MKIKFLLSSLLFLTVITTASGKVWKITNNYYTFSPSTITINKGDTVFFEISLGHDVKEVSKSTWDSKGNAALSGGFQTPFGGGFVLPTALGNGTHYYVCTPHAYMGMKGSIIVQTVTSIENNRNTANISVFPNPSTNRINVRVNNNLTDLPFTITDLTGKPVLTGKLENETTLVDIGKLATGNYLLQVGNQMKQTVKFVKN
jgi:plastocyanin